MKVLLINKFHYMKGGSETYYFAQANALKSKGHDVIFFSMQDEKNLPCDQSEYFAPNVEYNGEIRLKSKISIIKKFFYSAEAARGIEKLIKEEKPDIAHIGLIHRQLTFSVVDVLKKYDIPIVMTMHDLIFACPCYTMLTNGQICEDCVNKSVLNCIKKRCVKNSLSKSILAAIEKKYLFHYKYYNEIDLYIAECEHYKRLMSKSRFTTSNIIVKTNFLPVDQVFEPTTNYDNYVLYFGRFSIEKGIITLLKAHKRNTCKYRLVLVGAGPIEQDVNDYISKNKLDNIEVLGPIYGEQMDRILEKAKVIVVPSEWYENCPYTILQSIAKGKIVIASNIGGLPELIKDKETGYLFNPKDPSDLAKKISEVMDMNKEEYVKMSHRIVNEAKRKHHWEIYINSLIDEYKLLIDKVKNKNLID